MLYPFDKMYRSKFNRFLFATIASVTSLLFAPVAHADFLVDFEDVGSSLGAEDFYNGADGAGGFNSGTVGFSNSYGMSGGFEFWDGWSYSNITDNSTPGFSNQYAAIFGMGDLGSATYGVAFSDTASVVAAAGQTISSFSMTNTTYAGLSMRDGDSFAKKFGGTGGDDPDFLKIDIDGFDGAGNQTGTVEFYLADFRFSDNSQDYILDQWATVDVSSLSAQRLGFRFDSSDVGQFGINTPTYFAADNFIIETVPEPNLLAAFFAIGCLYLGRRTRE